jgi:adenylylsulfate kinase-like enzyme
MIYSFTGQPHAGKTTLAKHLKNVLEFNNPEKKVFIIDGDDLRRILNNKDYSEAGRRDNISKAYAIARFLHKDDEHDVILAVVSPFRDLREDLKLDNNVVEVYIHTSDIRGRENFHVGNYEEPLIDFISIDTSGVDEMTSMNELLEKIQQKHKENGN